MTATADNPEAQGLWTVFVYIAGDNELARNARKSLRGIEKGGSSGAVRTVVQIDEARDVGATRFVGENGSFRQEESIGLIDTGDPRPLIDFLKWGMSKYPAMNYLCVLWGHGAGLDQRTKGFAPGGLKNECFGGRNVDSSPRSQKEQWSDLLYEGLEEILHDYTTGHYLSNTCLKYALDEVSRSTGRKTDILGLDACLMGMTEIVCDFRDSVHFAVTSEDTEPKASWPYQEIVSRLISNPQISPADLGRFIVQRYMKAFSTKERRRGLTLSLCDLRKAERLVASIKNLSRCLIDLISHDGKIEIDHARAVAPRFDRDYVDLEGFCQALANAEVSQGVKDCCGSVIRAVKNDFVIYSESAGRNLRHASGMSIFFPEEEHSRARKPIASQTRSKSRSGNRVALVPKPVILIRSSYKELSFVKETGWDRFLLAYLGFDGEQERLDINAGGAMSVDQAAGHDGRKKPTGPRKKPRKKSGRKKPYTKRKTPPTRRMKP